WMHIELIAVRPVIHDVQPKGITLGQGNPQITIFGERLSDAVQVNFYANSDDDEAELSVHEFTVTAGQGQPDRLTFTLDENSGLDAGTYFLSVVTPFGESGRTPFVVLGPPEVFHFDPDPVIVGKEPVEITLFGRNLDGAVVQLLDPPESVAYEFEPSHIESDRLAFELQGVAPSADYSLRVVTPVGTYTLWPFVVLAVPVIEQVEPSQIFVGSEPMPVEITVFGQNLQNLSSVDQPQAPPSVRLYDENDDFIDALDVLSHESDQLIAVWHGVSYENAGTYRLTVRTNAGESDWMHIELIAVRPVIHDIQPKGITLGQG